MKKLIFLLILVISGCGSSSPNQTITNHQALDNFQSESFSSESTSSTQTNSTTFETTQEYVDFMYENVRSLEDTLSLLNINLSQIIESEGEDDSLYVIRQGLVTQTQTEKEMIKNATPISEELEDLHTYVIQSYFYNLEDKINQYEISQTITDEERQALIESNVENQRLGSHYLGLAWQELNRLSETTYSRK